MFRKNSSVEVNKRNGSLVDMPNQLIAVPKIPLSVDEIAEKYQEKLFYYSGLNDSNKNRYAEEIYTDIERYRSLVDVMINFEEGEFLETRMQEFNNYLDLFL